MDNAKTAVKRISVLTCVIFFVLSMAINLLFWFSLDKRLPNLAFAFIILGISFLISAITLAVKRKKKFPDGNITKWLGRSACIYTSLALFLNTLVYMVQSGLFWNISSILLIIVFSLSVGACTVWFRPKKFIYGALLYFVLTGVIYYLITVSIGGYGEGNRYIVLIGVYIIIYAICTIICYLIKRSLDKDKQNNLPYKNQFND